MTLDGLDYRFLVPHSRSRVQAGWRIGHRPRPALRCHILPRYAAMLLYCFQRKYSAGSRLRLAMIVWMWSIEERRDAESATQP